jgi:hypothetical protein
VAGSNPTFTAAPASSGATGNVESPGASAGGSFVATSPADAVVTPASATDAVFASPADRPFRLGTASDPLVLSDDELLADLAADVTKAWTG